MRGHPARPRGRARRPARRSATPPSAIFPDTLSGAVGPRLGRRGRRARPRSMRDLPRGGRERVRRHRYAEGLARTKARRSRAGAGSGQGDPDPASLIGGVRESCGSLLDRGVEDRSADPRELEPRPVRPCLGLLDADRGPPLGVGELDLPERTGRRELAVPVREGNGPRVTVDPHRRPGEAAGTQPHGGTSG